MKALGAFGLGLLSFALFMFFGETFGLAVAFAVLTVYFFACQYLLSRGHTDAPRDDVGLMFALDATMVFCAMLVICVEKPDVVMFQVPVMLGATGIGTYLGAVVAARSARRMVMRH